MTREAPLSDLFYLIDDLLPKDQQLLLVTPETSAVTALALMERHQITQVPVATGGTVVGVFSYTSYARALVAHAGSIEPGATLVGACMEPAVFAAPQDKLAEKLDELANHGVMLVGRPERLLGLVTPTDALRYLHSVASPFLMVTEIELALRGLLLRAVPPETLRELIGLALPETRHRTADDLLEGLTFYDYGRLISNDTAWQRLSAVFGGSAEANRQHELARLDAVRQTRNELFHFRRPLEPQDLTTLAGYRDLLLQRVRAAE